MTKTVLTLIAAALVAGSWSTIEAFGRKALEDTLADESAESQLGVLPADWEARYLEGVDGLTDHAHRIFERMVSVRADLSAVRTSIESARHDHEQKESVLDSLAAALRQATAAGASEVVWNGRSMGSARDARQTLTRWESELMAAESGSFELSASEASMAKAERALSTARRRLLARADAMRRDLGVRKARLDAAEAVRELAAVEQMGRTLSTQPDLAEVDRIVRLIDRTLLEAGAREQLLAEEASSRRPRGSLAEAVDRHETAHRRLDVKARIEARLAAAE